MSQIEELRQIIVGGNADQLAELKERIENVERRAVDVAEVLPPAIVAGLKEDGQSLVNALEAPVSMSLKQAIRSEPEDYAEILYPVMAPSIRKAISQAISSLLVTINRTIESATSVEGLKTRIQSMRTGVPYAQLALRNALLFRVEHLYLIERGSGMLIKEVASQDSESLDSDAVSAMFSAIQSFVQDSFTRDPTAMLTDLKVGEHNVWVAHGPTLMLACVIFGDAPEGLKTDLYDALYKIRTGYANPIAQFNGDTSGFEDVEDLMQPLLQLELKDIDAHARRAPDGSPIEKKRTRFFPFLLLLLVAGYFAYKWVDKSTKLDTVAHYMRQEPGIAATEVYWQDGKIVVEGLKDPDARVPYAVLEAYDISREQLEFRTIPFRSLELGMELQRFRDELTLPSGVYLSARDGEVYLYGEAPIDWLNDNDVRIRQLSADRRLTISRLSASLESVSDLLRANFKSQELRGVRMSSVARDELTVLQIGGVLESNKLALLKALFAGSHWVDVTAKQGVEG